jgi:hypothetical protein
MCVVVIVVVLLLLLIQYFIIFGIYETTPLHDTISNSAWLFLLCASAAVSALSLLCAAAVAAVLPTLVHLHPITQYHRNKTIPLHNNTRYSIVIVVVTT